jgi:hypothetical protein
MAGNVISMVETGIPAAPDVAALNAMTSPMVMVHKIIPRPGSKRESQMIVNAMSGPKVKTKTILALQDQIADVTKYPDGGPGLYHFEVTDEGSTAKVVWETRIGGSRTEEELAPQPAGVAPPRAAVVAATNAALPMSPESENLGNGFVYNSKYGILATPDGRMVPWRPGSPLPDLNPVPQAPPAPNSTPLAFQLPNQPQAVSPEVIELRAQNTAIQNELAKTREEARERDRQQELARIQAEHARQLAELREAQDKQMAEMRELVKSATSKPAVDPEVVEMRRRLELRDQQDAMRSEMAAKMATLEAAVRAASENRGPDPLITVFTQLLSQQASSSSENMRLMREASAAQVALASSSSEKLTDLLQRQLEQSKDSGMSVLNEKAVGVIGSLMELAARVNGVASGGSGTDWMAVINTLADKAGTGLAAWSNMRAREAAAETAKANATVVQTQAAERRRLHSIPAQEAPPAQAAADAPAAPVAPVAPAAPAASEPADPLRVASRAELHAAFGKIEDAQFFGPFFESVADLRQRFAKNPSEFSADDVAGLIMEARGFIVEAAQKTGVLPIAAELLGKGQYDYLFERMLPELNQGFWHEASVALKAKVAAEGFSKQGT